MTSLVTPETLNEVMGFDHVIRVHADGTVSHPRDKHAPESPYVYVDSDGQQTDIGPNEVQGLWEPWELMRGYTGQHGYRGPVMHPSEYVGGRMAKDILEAPGLYVVLEVRCETLEDDGCEDCDHEPAGWCVARILEEG